MQDTSIEHPGSGQRRASPRLVAESRAALAFVKPYRARLNSWQLESAHLRAKARAHQSSEVERFAAIARLSELRLEAEATYADLLQQLPEGISHSRIEDTCRALKRFADLVADETSGTTAPGL